MKHKFTSKDLDLFEKVGITAEDVASQFAVLEKDMTTTKLTRPAKVNDGIMELSVDEMHAYAETFDREKNTFSLVRFIPASGMATRMFKFLHYFLGRYDAKKDTLRSYLNREKTYKLGVFIGGLEKFPFYKQIKSQIAAIDNGAFQHDYRYLFIQKTVQRLSTLPKALIPFHAYQGHMRTAAEEQLIFSKGFMNVDNTMNIHFTIPPNTTKAFQEVLSPAVSKIKDENEIRTQLSFSHQKRSTDAVAALLDNSPYRDEKGNLFFRAAGHGSLLDNLNDLEEEIIFLSNIDNVAVEVYHEKAAFFKKILAGVLIARLQQVHRYCRAMDEQESCAVDEISRFAKEKLNIHIPASLTGDALFSFLKQKLDRPLRVCGMVRNEGEPGGGPFWVDKDGQLSLQIVEGAQIKNSDKLQKNIFKAGTHFNPVDIVCATHNYKGQKYDLKKFVDRDSCFVVQKSLGGTNIKAMEHPGLWNGAMADWNTIFVEVPVRTFNPVKTVNDLLRPMHQSI